jgi:hypothetical protein
MPVFLDGWGFMNEWKQVKERLSQKIQIYISSSSIAIEDKQKRKQSRHFRIYVPISMEDLLLISNKD